MGRKVAWRVCARRAFVVQTNGGQILAKVDKTELYLLEKLPPAPTTVPPSTTTTQPPNPGGNTFSDVPASHPYYDAIEGMVAAARPPRPRWAFGSRTGGDPLPEVSPPVGTQGTAVSTRLRFGQREPR